MKRTRMVSLYLAALALIMLWGSALAYTPPCQMVQGPFLDQTRSSTTVTFSAHDPVKGQWMQGEWTEPLGVDDLEVTLGAPYQGIISFQVVDKTTPPEWTTSIYFYVYDPARGQWAGSTMYAPASYLFSFITTDGVCFFHWTIANGSSQDSYDWAFVYDPAAGEWRYTFWEFSGFDDTANHIVKDGAVAFTIENYPSVGLSQVHFAIYDPQLGDWVKQYDQGGDVFYDLQITAGTVSYKLMGNTTAWGYSYITKNWLADDYTRPLAYFLAQPTKGRCPLHVWFTDMSLGGSSWTYGFGDGSSDSVRSTFHTYKSAGKYAAEFRVAGPGGEASTPQRLVVTSGAQPHLLLLLN